MFQAQNWADMSPELEKVAARAKREPAAIFHSLAHHITPALLAQCFHRQRAAAAPGVDGVTKEEYGVRLEERPQDLHTRLRDKRYRHQPIKRVHIPKESGGTRPLGLSAFEDKIVQDALRVVLSAVYEQDFMEDSYGFRPGRGAHDALRALNRAAMRGRANWILEADIRGFFDSVPHGRLMEMLRKRVRDRSLERLVGKCLRAGVLEGEAITTPDTGTPQGSILSPLLANIYLHHVLDRWFEDEVKPRLRGRAELVRYADDFVLCFEREDDARRVFEVLPKRMAAFGLSLHPDKTRLVRFIRPGREQTGGKGPGAFDFLGFTMYWKRMRQGSWMLSFQTRSARVRRAIQRVGEFCRRHRHRPLKEQHLGMSRRLRGHFNYFGVNGNVDALNQVFWAAKHLWVKWLRRRSQRSRSWEHFRGILKRFPLPNPRVVVNIWRD